MHLKKNGFVFLIKFLILLLVLPQFWAFSSHILCANCSVSKFCQCYFVSFFHLWPKAYDSMQGSKKNIPMLQSMYYNVQDLNVNFNFEGWGKCAEQQTALQNWRWINNLWNLAFSRSHNNSWKGFHWFPQIILMNHN